MKYIYLTLFLLCAILIFPQNKVSDDWKKESNKFRLESLAKDIINADFYQLKSMAMSLGLPEESNSAAYREALANYYNIQLLDKKIDVKKNVETIELVRAGELKTFKFVEDDEENLHIIGKVKLIIHQKDEENKEVSRTIEADEIFINTKNKEISGKGNVRFKDDRLDYTGTQLYYDYSINRGILFKGKTELIKGGESGLDGAFFEGEQVSQTGKEDIILYNGTLTTCEEENPHWYLKVSRLWIGEKGEWGVLNGIVFVGPIPFFYFPIYYHPKDLLINPSFGFKSREGWYLNTTYYVFGEKEKAEDTESTSTEGQETVQISSTYLVNNRRKDPSPDKVKRITSSEIHKKLNDFYGKHEFYQKNPRYKIYPNNLDSIDLALNVFTDAYTNLGFYWGAYFYINAKYLNFPFKLSILTDFALSRNIWKEDETGLYYPYNPADKLTVSNNTFYDLSLNPLTFRTSQWAKMSGSFLKNYINFDYEWQFEYVSDRNYFIDFYNRKLDFTYFDVLADTLSYGIKSQSEEYSGLDTSIEKVENRYDKEYTDNYLSTNIQPKSIPDVFGLPLLSSINLDIESRIRHINTEIEKYKDIVEEDPKANRYLLYSFTVPELKELRAEGTILDYDTFSGMPDKIGLYKNRVKDTKKDASEKLINNLYININNIKNIDATSDTTKIDYKLMLPMFSKKIPFSKIKKDLLEYEDVLNGNEKYIYEGMKKEIKDDKEIELKKKRDEIKEKIRKFNDVVKVDLYSKKEYDIIKPIDFNLTYKVVEKLTNKFLFDSSNNSPKYDEYDTTQKLFFGLVDEEARVNEENKELIDEITENFKISNILTFSLDGTFNLLKIADTSLWYMKPNMTVSSERYYDVIDIYLNYLDNLDTTSAERKDKAEALNTENFGNTKFYIKYSDTITNDLSFGIYRIKGTKIETSMIFDVFAHNLLKENNFRKLNKLNRFDNEYETVDEILYDNRRSYEKINKLETKFIANVNILHEKNPHQLSMSAGPLIKWVIPSTEITRMKSSLWTDEQNSILWSSNILDEAKQYIYYRRQGNNLNTKIGEFFSYNYFWVGPKYYRKMLDNITYSIQYSYKYNTLNVVTLTNDLIFVFDNIGVFSNLDPAEKTFCLYPDDNFSINFLNSTISYVMSIDFDKIANPYIEEDLDEYEQELDENKIMKMTNTHTLKFIVPGDIFKFKLTKGDWLKFSFTSEFRWDRTVGEWDNGSKYNYFFLESQTVSLYLLMDIFKLDLRFKKFNFQETGYGFELDSGTIDIGYKITEIPVFFRYFKLILEPRLVYDFVVKHNPYYEGTSLKQYNSDYYSKNILSFVFNIDLIIGEGTKFETLVHFGIISENKKMYRYYTDDGISMFFEDLAKSFGIAVETDDNKSALQRRRESPFNLQKIEFWIQHAICDWDLTFKYEGQPVVSTITGRYNWENTFEFSVSWGDKSKKKLRKNQLMKMLNKSKVDAVYNYYDQDRGVWTGEWKQPVLSLDPDEE